MRKDLLSLAILGLTLMAFSKEGFSYPPAVGILGKSENCLSCHVDQGPWKDEGRTIIDILDKETLESLRQPDGTFLVETRRGTVRTLLTVIGRSQDDPEKPPYRNAWLYVDPSTIGSNSLSKFAPGWDVNLPMSCRVVGDQVQGYEGATITALPMSIRPTDAAQDAELSLQVMLTKGESVKGKPKEGMVGNYFERKVFLKVLE